MALCRAEKSRSPLAAIYQARYHQLASLPQGPPGSKDQSYTICGITSTQALRTQITRYYHLTDRPTTQKRKN
ncbi:hypothetical protein HYQ46_005642 [Verticillium longisporum]|nr:hypothetical protein HYQ46_005642 [Verticillium longisporum]